MTQMAFIHFPVRDLAKSTAFYEILGFQKNAQWSDDNVSSIVISDTIVIQLLTEAFFNQMGQANGLSIAPAGSVSAAHAFSRESREAVDTLIDAATAGGGEVIGDPMDEGFMYSRSIRDLDGHVLDFLYVDQTAVPG